MVKRPLQRVVAVLVMLFWSRTRTMHRQASKLRTKPSWHARTHARTHSFSKGIRRCKEKLVMQTLPEVKKSRGLGLWRVGVKPRTTAQSWPSLLGGNRRVAFVWRTGLQGFVPVTCTAGTLVSCREALRKLGEPRALGVRDSTIGHLAYLIPSQCLSNRRSQERRLQERSNEKWVIANVIALASRRRGQLQPGLGCKVRYCNIYP